MGEKVRIVVKRPNEDFEIVEVDKGYRFKNAIEPFVHERCDFVKCSNDGLLTVAVDEEGLLKGLEPNFYMETNHFPAECLVGVAVFTRIEYVNVFTTEIYDYTLTDLTDEDIEHIKKTLDKDYQVYVGNVYKASGGRLKPRYEKWCF